MDSTITHTDGPAEAPQASGADRPEERPGVPMEAESPTAHREPPEPQMRGRRRHLHHTGLDEPTAVIGNSVPPRGLSGIMRRAAYGIPEHYARHWAILMAADRVDVLEDRLGEAVAEPMERIGFDVGAQYARKNPLAVLGGALIGAWVAKKVIF